MLLKFIKHKRKSTDFISSLLCRTFLSSTRAVCRGDLNSHVHCGDGPNLLFWFKPGQRKRCDNCDGTNQFDSFLISNFTIRPVGYVFVYVMHGSKIKKILANSNTRGISCKIIQERGISQCYKCIGTISRLGITATQSPSLEHPTQNYHVLHMLTRTDFKFALFVNGQATYNIL